MQPKKLYRRRLKDLFYQVKIHPWYQKIIQLPMWMRILLGIGLFLFGIIGILTPIPAGFFFLILSFALFLGIKEARKHSIRIFFLLRLHRVIEYVRQKFRR